MARMIYGPVLAECISVGPASAAKALNWSDVNRRFVGLTGMAAIYESERERPGRPFLCFYKPGSTGWKHDDGAVYNESDWWLKTYFGEWAYEDGKIHFRTRTTRHIFRVVGGKAMLDLEHLLMRNGKPVYIVENGDAHWELSMDAADYLLDRDVAQYGKTWFAYDREPEQDKPFTPDGFTYEFERALEKNLLDMSVVNARRFGHAIRSAIRMLAREAGCYGLRNEDYYLDTKTFLEQMEARLSAKVEGENHE